jgi:hypothetical protein
MPMAVSGPASSARNARRSSQRLATREEGEEGEDIALAVGSLVREANAVPLDKSCHIQQRKYPLFYTYKFFDLRFFGVIIIDRPSICIFTVVGTIVLFNAFRLFSPKMSTYCVHGLCVALAVLLDFLFQKVHEIMS